MVGRVLMEIFSSRELAIGFWLITFILCGLSSNKFRPILKSLVGSFFNKYIFIPVLGLGINVAAISYLLIEIDVWSFNQYKNVVLWFFIVGIYSLFQVVSANSKGQYLKDMFIDMFKLTTFFEFVITFYNFNFWFELIFIPVMSFVLLLAMFSERNKDHKVVADFFNWLIMIVGFCVVTYVCYQLLIDYEGFFNEGTVYDFIVPVFLTIGVFPYLYIISVYTVYERLFRRLDFKFKGEIFLSHMKSKVFFCFNFNLSHLKRWDRYVMIHGVKSKSEFDRSIKKVRSLLRKDKKRVFVAFNKGWSYYDSIRYLKGYSMVTSYYDHLYNGEWSASSESLKLGEGTFCNNITYHIDGDENAVKCLTLVMHVDDVELFDVALDKFREISDYLFRKAIPSGKGLSIETESVGGKETDIYQTNIVELEGRQVMIQKRNHVGRDTFEVRFSLSVDKKSFKYLDTI